MDMIYQSELTECGLASIAMIASAHGHHTDMVTLRAKYPIAFRGTTLQDIMSIADDFGLKTLATRCEPKDLNDIQLPAILHWRMDHFVVLAERKGSRYVLHDPAHGRVTVNFKEIDECFTGVVLEAWPDPRFKKQQSNKKLGISKIIPRINGLVSSMFLLIGLTLGIELLFISIPIIQQFILDDAVVRADTELLAVLVMAAFIFLIGISITKAIRGLLQRNLISTLSIVVPSQIFHYMSNLPVSWFTGRSRADIMSRFDSSEVVQNTLTTGIVIAIIDGLVVSIVFVVMIIYSPFLATVSLVSVIFYVLVRLIWYQEYRDLHYSSIIEYAGMQNILWETLSGMATVKAFNAEQRRRAQYMSQRTKYVRKQGQIERSNVSFRFAHDISTTIEIVIILYFGAKAVLSNDMSIGMFIAFLSFRDNFINKSLLLVDKYIEFRNLGIHLERLADLLLTDPERRPSAPFLMNNEIKGDLYIKQVTFSYGKYEKNILDNCSLQIFAGEMLAITGPSGSGKTTLFKILSGEVEPQAGSVTIDGIPVRSIGLDKLRSLIGVVRQDDTLFTGTILENIAFFDPDINHERVYSAAKAAQIYDEIQQSPMGFRTQVVAMGASMSGGQIQRILIARALYRNPVILLFDEATSELDVNNEKLLAESLQSLSVTRILIAHRPETIAMADRVVDIRDINNGNAITVN